MVNSSVNLLLILVASVCAAPEKSHSTAQSSSTPTNVGFNVQVSADIAEILKKNPSLGITVPSVSTSADNPIEVHIPADQVKFLHTKYEPESQRQAKLEAWIEHVKKTSSQLAKQKSKLIDLYNKIFKMKNSAAFKEMLKNDGYKYVIKSITTEPIHIDFPNLPDWHKDEFEEWRHDILPDSKIFCFEYKKINYKLLVNLGSQDCNDGVFGALYGDKSEKIVDLLSTGDMETTIESIKTHDAVIEHGFLAQLPPYLRYFEVKLHGSTQLEYLIFKILTENDCLYDIDGIDTEYCDDSDNED